MVKKIKRREVENIEAEMNKELGLESSKEEDIEKELKYIG